MHDELRINNAKPYRVSQFRLAANAMILRSSPAYNFPVYQTSASKTAYLQYLCLRAICSPDLYGQSNCLSTLFTNCMHYHTILDILLALHMTN